MGLARTVEFNVVPIRQCHIICHCVVQGVAYLVDGISFDLMVGNFMLFGRLAIIFGLGGLSAEVATRSPRLGKISRGVVVVAAVFTIILFIWRC